MPTATISQKAYKKLLDEHRHLQSQFRELRVVVERIARDELVPDTVRRLEKRSRSIDQGGGIRFQSVGEMRKYLRAL